MSYRRLYLAPLFLSVASALAMTGCSSGPTPGEVANSNAAATGLGVNGYLWRAALDTLSFMPLVSEDPFGGVVISDWYAPPETPNERFKVDIYILDRQLNAEALKATVFRQVRAAGTDWSEAAVDAKTAGDLENQILTRARQMRIASINAASQK